MLKRTIYSAPRLSGSSHPLNAATPPAEPVTLRAALSHRPFARFLIARFAGSLAVQMQTVAVGVQVYGLTHDPLDLGFVGLSQFLPFLLFVLLAGQAADRWNRKRIVLACFALEFLCAAALLGFTLSGLKAVWPVFTVMVFLGIARASMAPANQALLPNLVPTRLLGTAVGVSSSMWQVATIAGPAIGGVVYAHWGPGTVYTSVAALLAVALVATVAMASPAQAAPTAPATWRTVVEGLHFVRRRPILLGAISLDLFAVLFGGATALLPAYASDVLKIGPDGLGWLRAAPGIGAALTAIALTFRPIGRQVGPAMFAGVFVFGAGTVLFGLSHSFWLSLGALAVLGAADMVSVFVRHMLVQLDTPDGMRGRVGAVNAMFIGASNELGEFESGFTAAWWGLVPAVVIGGIATLVVAVAWSRLFPQLRRMDRFPQP